MVVRQQLVTSGEGRPVLVKSAPAGPDADRLGHEAALLSLAAHPGVVTVVADHELDGGGRELHLAVAGSRTAADLPPDPVDTAGLLAALATTVADLHDLGVVHGRITADHVVIARDGRPVLCGLAGAAPVGAAPWGGGRALEPADDVAALGRLLGDLLDRSAADPGAARTWGWRPVGGRTVAALRAVAEAATGIEPPTAREVAEAVLAAAPDAHLPGDPAPVPGAGGRWAGVLRWLGLDQFEPPGAPATGAPAARARARPLRVAGPAATPVGAGHRHRVRDPDGAPARPLLAGPAGGTADGDRPGPEGGSRRFPFVPALAVAGLGLLAFGVGGLLRPAGPVVPPGRGPVAEPHASRGSATTLEVGGVRYAVGEEGDVLAVGDWDCDGVATVAVVRPRTGEVFVFQGWATADRPAIATLAAEVPGAASAAGVDADGDGCPTLVVADAAGIATEVPT